MIDYNKMDFRKINFGKADAQEEGVECPRLLIDGYYEVNNVVQKSLPNFNFLDFRV